MKTSGPAHRGNVRGSGYFWSIELIKDQATKETFTPARIRRRRSQEINDDKNRVAVRPDGVPVLVHNGHQVLVKSGAVLPVPGGAMLASQVPDRRPRSSTDACVAGLAIITTDGAVVNTSGHPRDVVLLMDIANVMGSRPDGWWRDRAAAATRLLNALGPLTDLEVSLPDRRQTVRITEVRAVVEGAAKRADGPATVSVLRAETDGDSAIVEEANRLAASGKVPLVITADRGLHRRLPKPAFIAGPSWLNRLLGR